MSDVLELSKPGLGNEIDNLIARAIQSSRPDTEKLISRYRLAIRHYFTEFHQSEESDHILLARVWQEAADELSPYKFAKLEELVNKDIEQLISVETCFRD